MKRLINQLWRAKKRLLSHRVVGAGYITQGRVMARAINGTPSSVGLINWSKRLTVMVRFRILFWVFRRFEASVH